MGSTVGSTENGEHMGKYTGSTEGNSMVSHWTRKCAEKAGCERRKAV